jgi:hypothetical protein
MSLGISTLSKKGLTILIVELNLTMWVRMAVLNLVCIGSPRAGLKHVEYLQVPRRYLEAQRHLFVDIVALVIVVNYPLNLLR